MAFTVNIVNNTDKYIAITGLDNAEQWSSSGNYLTYKDEVSDDWPAFTSETQFTKSDGKTADGRVWRFVVPPRGSAKLFEWHAMILNPGPNPSAQAEFSLLWCIDDRCQPSEGFKDWRDWVPDPANPEGPITVIHSEAVPTGMPYFRVKLQARQTTSGPQANATIDRHIGTNGYSAVSGLAPFVGPKGLKYVPLAMNSFGLKATGADFGTSVTVTFDTQDSVKLLGDLAKQVGSPIPAACWRNSTVPAMATVALVREAADRNGFMRWDQYHGYTYASAYQEVAVSLPNEERLYCVMTDYNQNKAVKLTSRNGAFVHFDPPSAADGSAPSFATPVADILWTDHLKLCETGGFMKS